MSPLSRDLFRIVLCPDKVIFLHRKRLLRSRIERKATWQNASILSPEAPAWRATVETLRANLPNGAIRSTEAAVLLSNHFCHYALLKQNDQLSDASDNLAYARHKLATIYGEAAAGWDIRLSGAGRQDGHLVSAVPRSLLDELRALFRERNLPLTSVRPHFAVAFNRCRPALQERTAWLVVHEDGRLIVCYFQDGHWRLLASRRVGPRWKTELSDVLDRERQQLGLEQSESRQVLLYAPHLLHAGEFKGGAYQVELVDPNVSRDLGEGDRAAYAMAA